MAESHQKLYENFHNGTITDNPLSSGATTINSSEFADLPVVASPEFVSIVLDPLGVDGDPEIVSITTHTASATSVTVTRGEETNLNGSAARAHNSGTAWRWPVTAQDLLDFRATANDHINESLVDAKGDLLVATAADTVGRLAVEATDEDFLVVDASTSTGLAWAPGDGIFVGDDVDSLAVTAATETALEVGQLLDPRGWFVGGATVTPDIAGWYFCVGFSALSTATTVITQRRTVLLKNGTADSKTRLVDSAGTASSTWPQTTSGIIQLNGSTDTIEVAGYFTESSGSGARNMVGALAVYLLFRT